MMYCTSTAVRSHGVQGSSLLQMVPWAAVQSLLLLTYRSTWIDKATATHALTRIMSCMSCHDRSDLCVRTYS